MIKKVKPGFKKIISFAGILFFLFLADSSYAYQEEGCGGECAECHEIEQKEVEKILVGFRVKVLGVDQGPIKGMWQVEVEQDGKKFPIYIHYSKNYIISGDIFEVKTKKKIGMTVTPKEKSRKKIDCSKIPLDDALLIGSETATKTAIVFTDPDCPYCGKLHKEMKKVVSRRKDIAFYIKLYPLLMLHPDAYDKSVAIVCEKSLKMLDDAFEGKKIPAPKCKTTQIDENIKLAESLGISGTPTIILKDNSIIPGYVNADTLIRLIDETSK